MKINYNLLCIFCCIIFIMIKNIRFALSIANHREYNYLNNYIYSSNNNIFNKNIKYIPCFSCGLGNKLLGLISSIAYGIAYSYALKVVDWDSLWWYFLFPLKMDKYTHMYNVTYKGHFYGIKSVIDNIDTRNYLLKIGIIKYNNNSIIMINNLAYKISKYFLQLSHAVKSKINIKHINKIHFGFHIRTGKADGKEYSLQYLKYKDIIIISNFVRIMQPNESVYLSSDSPDVKNSYKKLIPNLYYLNSSICNSGFGLLKENNKCAIEAITDYYILSKCKFLILTRCSSFSLVSLFANEIGYNNKKMYKYFGKCKLHSDLYT